MVRLFLTAVNLSSIIQVDEVIIAQQPAIGLKIYPKGKRWQVRFYIKVVFVIQLSKL